MKLTQTRITLLISLAFLLVFNFRFFANVLKTYPLSLSTLPFLLSIAVVLFLVTNILLNVIRIRYILKGQLIFLLIASSIVAYYMDTFSAVIDETMYTNIFSTNVSEARDLITLRFIGYILILGILPSIFVYKCKIHYSTFWKETKARLISIGGSLLLGLALVLLFSKNYASFFRNHKPLRYNANPAYYLYTGGLMLKKKTFTKKHEFVKISQDVKIADDKAKRKLIIFVVGEAARSDRFSLNNYSKETNPLLKKEDVVSFPNVYSCGTATAIAVPCMFSNLTRSNFEIDTAKYRENILDVLNATGKVSILWRDNNSSSKNVADRLQYEDYMSKTNNTICDEECRDIGMLVGLQDYIEKKNDGSILIVLHQMGNHGPAYYRRYTPEFKKFTPICESTQLEQCSNEEIGNAYDNVILYTDFFLSKTIDLLKKNSTKFDTMLFYMSDHGESLGENGLYLHSIPYMMAPKEQKNIATVFWFGGDWKTRYSKDFLLARKNNEYSQDYVFHSLLGLFNVQTSLYKKELDIFAK